MDNFDELSDEALINALAEEAEWAMEPLYERYNRVLYSLAYRMVADHQVAEDLLQEAFHNQVQFVAGLSPLSIIAPSTIYALYAAVPV